MFNIDMLGSLTKLSGLMEESRTGVQKDQRETFKKAGKKDSRSSKEAKTRRVSRNTHKVAIEKPCGKRIVASAYINDDGDLVLKCESEINVSKQLAKTIRSICEGSG